MGTTLTIFIGSKDPMLMAKLNMCDTACCLVDTDDISKYEGYLPAFLTEDKARILQFSKNIFNQSSDPGFGFVLDDSFPENAEYKLFKETISKDLDTQIGDIKAKRLYQEIELQNSLINFPSMLLGRKVSELKNQVSGKRALVLCDNLIEGEFFQKIRQNNDQYILIAPLDLLAALEATEIKVDFLVCTSIDKVPLQLNKASLGISVIADVTSQPGAIKDFKNVFWSSSPNFLLLEKEHEKLVDLESQWSVGRDSRLLAISVAKHLGCEEILLYSNNKEFDKTVEDFRESQAKELKIKFLKSDDDLNSTETINFTLSLKELEPEISRALEFVRAIEDDIDKEKEGEVLHSVLRACDYDALVKMRNGFVNYGLINYQESDLTKKKSYFLSLTRELRKLLQQKGLSEYDYRQEVSNKFTGKELFWDFEFELKVLAYANPRLAMDLQAFQGRPYIHDDIKYSFNHKFSVDLNYKRNGKWQSYSHPNLGFVDDFIEPLEDTGILIVPGVLDGKVQLELFEMYEDIPIVTLVNRPEDLAEILNHVPLISILGRRGLWIHGSDTELAIAYKSLISSDHMEPLLIDIDPEGVFKHISDLKKKVVS